VTPVARSRRLLGGVACWMNAGGPAGQLIDAEEAQQ
jgi:hypothetical protein